MGEIPRWTVWSMAIILLIIISGGSLMARVEINAEAPDFTLEDINGDPVSLSDFRGKKHVVLVLNRGFT
jgi:cytochrome oxidase Cu insertion factor (SCO1/SenC/PrrC family)